VQLEFEAPRAVSQVRVTFDSDLSREIMPSISKWVQDRQSRSLPETLVRDFSVSFYQNGEKVREIAINGNTRRLRVLDLASPVVCGGLRVTVFSTHGCENARVFEIRAY
jgi:hypothetical protein